MKKGFFIIILSVLASFAWAENTIVKTEQENTNIVNEYLEQADAESRNQTALYSDLNTEEIESRRRQLNQLYGVVFLQIIVTPIILYILLAFIRKSKDYTEHAIVHTSGLVLVIQATILIVLASPTSEQLTAAIGVLAAIAGYLFGSSRSTHSHGSHEAEGSS